MLWWAIVLPRNVWVHFHQPLIPFPAMVSMISLSPHRASTERTPTIHRMSHQLPNRQSLCSKVFPTTQSIVMISFLIINKNPMATRRRSICPMTIVVRCHRKRLADSCWHHASSNHSRICASERKVIHLRKKIVLVPLIWPVLSSQISTFVLIFSSSASCPTSVLPLIFLQLV